ncbi:hypothetical protein [Endothiovibrio diazotrophicus]
MLGSLGESGLGRCRGRRCPVRGRCLRWALRDPTKKSVWLGAREGRHYRPCCAFAFIRVRLRTLFGARCAGRR